ncbi:Methyltransferase domain-containing protein [Actinopolyspora xinjiangensis]|uniref:Methyltransferase domain-containing protein n=1 Tax=Actinopolyspora xinjiangensis TaxID=405564 RepID=A0A1H0S7S8_9ACTN|nr:methyltransferase domain-containing protein [Actinopolyspora xinjiangensis]SDP37861.1 Methyltransferase domain-containing protein [Actinopolyspora xinjiangensis]
MTASEQVYGQGYAESVVRSHRRRTVDDSAAYLADRLRPGQHVLDVGCGPGTITVDLAERVAPGRVVGVDPGEPVLAQARAAAATASVHNVEFRRGDVWNLGFDDDTFDVVHAHQVLLHLTDPVAALREMLRVVRPEGVVAVRDTDYAGAIWWPADERLDRWLEVYRSVARANGTEPDAGRRLLSWAHTAGAVGVTPSASIWCHATPEERAWWGGMWADRMLGSRITEQAVAGGHATREELSAISTAWREWARHPDGWFALPHGEVLCHTPA